jgi:hypothetical protein
MYFDKYEKDLINGVISPDNEDDTNHYSGREKTALEYLRRARDKRLNYDTSGSFFILGVAFHYIQDSWTSIGPDNEDHRKYLDLIDRCEILDIHESIGEYYPVKRKRILDQFKSLEKRLKKPVESEEELNNLVIMRRPYESSAFLDLNFSFRVCYRVAEMVLKTMYNVKLQESLDLLHEEYINRVKETEAQELREIEACEVKAEVITLTDSYFSSFNRWSIAEKLKRKKERYLEKQHIKQVQHEFETQISKLCKPHENWYNIEKPSIDIDKVLIPKIEIKPLETNSIEKRIKMALEIGR